MYLFNNNRNVLHFFFFENVIKNIFKITKGREKYIKLKQFCRINFALMYIIYTVQSLNIASIGNCEWTTFLSYQIYSTRKYKVYSSQFLKT